VEKIFSFPCQFFFHKFSILGFNGAFRILHFGGASQVGAGIE
jgi:hypothetical protein